jgi:phospholipid-binding lipoprotein MlaA
LTVRDGIGYVFDIAMDPLTYFFPITGPPGNIAVSFGRRTEKMLNDRALNLDKYESVEEATVDLYSAVRNAYLTKRKQQIAE